MTMFIKLLLYLFVVVFLSVEVNSQVCVRQTYVTKNVPRTYRYEYFVTHSERCNSSFGWCFHSQWKTDIKERYEKISVLSSIEYCCDGYIRDYDFKNDSKITCKPICKPACVNGYCKYPGNCECNAGYIIYKQNNHTCIPFCEKGCGNGTCIAPNTCQCDLGYVPENGTCQPVCTKPCKNGICASPDKCECLPGYRISFHDYCEPHCSKGCNSGNCISPEKCHCYAGYVLEENIHPNRCVIQCSLLYGYNMCGKGTCEASNLCRCFPGYHPDYTQVRSYRDIQICVPMPTCTDCKGGDCIMSPKCVEKEVSMTTIIGNTTRTTSRMSTKTDASTTYSTSTTSLSLPSETTFKDKTLVKCNFNPCGNGLCVFSNRCRCFRGYHIHYLRLRGFVNGPVCVPVCTDCYGSDCVAPNKCLGKEISTTSHQDLCDVFQNCSKTISGDTTKTTPVKSTTETSTTSEASPRYETTTSSLILSSEMMANDKTLRNCNINPCAKEVFPTMNEDTTRTTSETRTTTETSIAPKSSIAYKTGKTSVSPSSKTTDTYKNSESENESTTEYNFVTNNSSKGEVTKGETMQMSWMQQHTMSILIPIIVVVTAGIIMLLVWRRTRIFNVFPRRTYVIQGNAPNNNEPQTLQKVQFFSNGNQGSVEIIHVIE